jgi:hypothetical protein
MNKLDAVKLGGMAYDTITGLRGRVTAKCERLTGDHSVLLETLDTTKRPIEQWASIERVEAIDDDEPEQD